LEIDVFGEIEIDGFLVVFYEEFFSAREIGDGLDAS